MRVCYFGTYDETFPRNKVIIQGLLENGVQVIKCQANIWSGTQDKIDEVKGLKRNPLRPSLLRRACGSYIKLIKEYRKCGPYDVMVVGYAGHLDMVLAWILARVRRKPLAFDAFLSLYSTVVEDRKLAGPRSPLALGLWLVDKLSCSLADMVFLDTEAHIKWFSKRFGLKMERFRRVLMGADVQQPRGQDPPLETPGRPFKVVYFGNFIPLHGVEYILGAARELLGHPDTVFELIGEGQTLNDAQRIAQEQGLSNVTFVHGWLPPEYLADFVRRADVCLGVFGTGQKADMVIPQKVVFSAALGRPVLTRDSQAIREVFTPGLNIMVCRAGSPQSLAAALLALKRDDSLRNHLAQNGQWLVQEKLSTQAIGKVVKEHLTTLCGGNG